MEKYEQLEQLKKIIHATHDSGDSEQQWFMSHAHSQDTRQFIQNHRHLTHSELQILSHLSDYDNATPFKILQTDSTLSQGMLSRYINRLSRQLLIEKYHPAHNKKEIFLKPTSLGYEIGTLHTELRQKIKEKETRILADYSNADINNMVEIVTALLNAHKDF